MIFPSPSSSTSSDTRLPGGSFLTISENASTPGAGLPPRDATTSPAARPSSSAGLSSSTDWITRKPSLDAARQESFRRVNRPAKCSADLEAIIKGIADFSRKFAGEIWLEILLVGNINDTVEDIAALQSAIGRIRPTREQLNTVVRPPFESFAKPLARKRIAEIKREIEKGFDGPVDILAGSMDNEPSDSGKGREGSGESISPDKAEDEIMEMLLRRPCTASDIAVTMNLDAERASEILKNMESQGRLTVKIHGGKKYYRMPTGQKTGNE